MTTYSRIFNHSLGCGSRFTVSHSVLADETYTGGLREIPARFLYNMLDVRSLYVIQGATVGAHRL